MPKVRPTTDNPTEEHEIDEVTEQSEWSDLDPNLQDFLGVMFPSKTQLREVHKSSEVMQALPKPSSCEEGYPEGVPLNDDGLPPKDWLLTHFKTKSGAIRYLLHNGGSVNAISKLLNVKYQHVRNVKVTQLKRGPNEDWTKV